MMDPTWLPTSLNSVVFGTTIAMWSKYFLGFTSSLFLTSSALELFVDSTTGNASSPLLYGILYEDIFHSGDGGLYAELIRNRAFQGSNSNGQASTVRNLDYWHPLGGVSLSLETSSPALSVALPAHMRVNVPQSADGEVGFFNEGFWGMKVESQAEYAVSFYMRGNYSGDIQCAFYSNTSGELLGESTIPVSLSIQKGWSVFSSNITTAKAGPDKNNTFRISLQGQSAAGQSLDFNLISVFPQTFKARKNGLRVDLTTALDNMGTKFLRMPGGNNMQGSGSPYRWKWNETIGPLMNRPGRPGVWGDINTDGFGLLELMQWSVDMNLEIVLGVWAGLYLNREVVSKQDLQPYVDDVLDELEFLTGPTSSKYGALRASLGYPQPFEVKYIEIGNEDYLNNGITSYADYRFDMFYNAIHSRYPNAQIISTIQIAALHNATAGVATDDHIYLSAAQTVAKFGAYDHVSRKYPIFVAEYAAIQGSVGDAPSGQLENPTLESATSEAVLLMGCERNSDIVYGTSHGALIKGLDEGFPTNVAVIKHSADSLLLSFSYYVQKMFASHYGTRTARTTSDSKLGPLYWSTTVSDAGQHYVKIVNYNGTATTSIVVNIPGAEATTGKVISLTGSKGAGSVNTVGNIQSVWKETEVSVVDGVVEFTLEGNYATAVLVV